MDDQYVRDTGDLDLDGCFAYYLAVVAFIVVEFFVLGELCEAVLKGDSVHAFAFDSEKLGSCTVIFYLEVLVVSVWVEPLDVDD